jgi:FMN-dependent NADH-azoreductase
MSQYLYIKSSILGAGSVTSEVVDAIHTAFAAAHPNAQHVVRDLGSNPLPHLTATVLGDVRSETPTDNAATVAALQAVKEVQDATTLVIAAPMYNFGVPSNLKAWFDHIAHPGKTFQYTATGPEGLLKGKNAIVVVATGGQYSEGPAKPYDIVEPYIRTVLGFLGITEVQILRVEGLAMGEAGAVSKAEVLAQVATL